MRTKRAAEWEILRKEREASEQEIEAIAEHESFQRLIDTLRAPRRGVEGNTDDPVQIVDIFLAGEGGRHQFGTAAEIPTEYGRITGPFEDGELTGKLMFDPDREQQKNP